MSRPGPKVPEDKNAARQRENQRTLWHHAKEGNAKAKEAIAKDSKGGKGSK